MPFFSLLVTLLSSFSGLQILKNSSTVLPEDHREYKAEISCWNQLGCRKGWASSFLSSILAVASCVFCCSIHSRQTPDMKSSVRLKGQNSSKTIGFHDWWTEKCYINKNSFNRDLPSPRHDGFSRHWLSIRYIQMIQFRKWHIKLELIQQFSNLVHDL